LQRGDEMKNRANYAKATHDRENGEQAWFAARVETAMKREVRGE